MPANFFSEEIEFQLEEPIQTQDWLATICSNHNHSLEDLNYIFCSDDYLLEINKQYLDHDYYTDIITFDNSEEEQVIEGDIYISVDRIKDNSKSLNTEFHQELHRVIAHGLLHLLGFGDETESEKKVMREKEDACLSLLEL